MNSVAISVPFIHDLQQYFLYIVVPAFLGLITIILSISVLIRWAVKAIHSGDLIYVTPAMTTDEYTGNYGWTRNH